MTGLIIELQSDALNSDVRVSDLLRKALVISKKLSVTEIEEWIDHELNGYPLDDESVPSYREIQGEIKIFNPYHGWQPLNFGDPKMAESLSKRKIMQPIGELVSIDLKNKDSHLQVPFPERIVNQLMKGMEPPALRPTLHVSPTEIVGILEAVRNQLLLWALELEKQGIMGEGMSFSNDEKEAAGPASYQIINNIGSMQNSQLQQGTHGSTQILDINNSLEGLNDFLSVLNDSSAQLSLMREQQSELEAEIKTIQSQLESPKPKQSIISECLGSIRSILEGAAGNVTATGLLAELAKFF